MLKEDQREKTLDSFKRLIWKGREHLLKKAFGKGIGQMLNKRIDFLYFLCFNLFLTSILWNVY